MRMHSSMCWGWSGFTRALLLLKRGLTLKVRPVPPLDVHVVDVSGFPGCHRGAPAARQRPWCARLLRIHARRRQCGNQRSRPTQGYSFFCQHCHLPLPMQGRRSDPPSDIRPSARSGIRPPLAGGGSRHGTPVNGDEPPRHSRSLSMPVQVNCKIQCWTGVGEGRRVATSATRKVAG